MIAINLEIDLHYREIEGGCRGIRRGVGVGVGVRGVYIP